uniref:RING-type domain-containing protein n=1 Tax=Caenorhabditis tropicalis TaxID=1561998 RepID=A0A1I7UUJ5_9PELO
MNPVPRRLRERLSERSERQHQILVSKAAETDQLRSKVAELETEMMEKALLFDEERVKMMKDIGSIQIRLVNAVQENVTISIEAEFKAGCLHRELNKEKDEKNELKKKYNILKDQVLLLESFENVQKVKEMVEKERQRANIARRMMQEAQELLREGQEKLEGNPKPWRLCNICFEEYSEHLEKSPRVLSCGHTFCLSCLKSIAGTNVLKCPVDRTFIEIDKEDLESLPKNFAVLHM